MFGLTGLALAAAVIAALVFFLVVESALFWAAVALVDGPELRLARTALFGAAIAGVWLPVTFLVFRILNVPLDPTGWGALTLTLALAVGVSLLVHWALPALLSIPLLPVPVRKGLLLAVFQVLLLLFLAVLIAAVVFVILAVVQIASRREGQPRSQLAPPALVAPAAGTRLP